MKQHSHLTRTLLIPLMAVSVFIAVLPGRSAIAQEIWTGGVVAADHPDASKAGLEMLEKGGNAVDAAVATSFCLSVVRPLSCGIGGGGFMVIYDPGGPDEGGKGAQAVAICYRERAPAGASPQFFEDMEDPEASIRGGSAVAVPGTVAGLLSILENFGTLSREDVLAPAIRAAESGFEVDAHYAKAARKIARTFNERPELQERFPFMWERFLGKGKLSEGDTLRLPEQARALRMIAADGVGAFYNGPIGASIVGTIQADGGVMNADDLTAYKPTFERPLTGRFRGDVVLTMPPPSSGGVALLQMLAILEAYETKSAEPLKRLGHNSPRYAHLLAEAMKFAFADRAMHLADPEFTDVPVKRMLDPEALRERAVMIRAGSTHEPDFYADAPAMAEDGGTSHISVIDANGMAVACTETINLEWGSWLVVEEFGFALNNQMDDFTARAGQANYYGLAQSDANLPAPGKRPLSSMTPTIVVGKDRQVRLIAGASGGPRIINGVLQAILNATLFDFDALRAVSASRFHHQWKPDQIRLEPYWDITNVNGGEMSLDELQAMMARVDSVHRFRSGLESRGHKLGEIEAVGAVQLVKKNGDGYEAASDPRKGGAPAGRNAK